MTGGAPTLERRGEHWAAERIAQRFRAQGGEKLVLGECRGRRQIHHAEPARVVEAYDRSVIRGEDKVVVFVQRGGALLANLDPAGHPEMQHHHGAVVHVPEQVLGPSLEPLDPAPGEALGESAWDWPAQVGASLLDFRENPALEDGHQAAANRFDLR